MTDNKNNTPEKKENQFLRSFTDKKVQELQEGFAATNFLNDLQQMEIPTVCDDGETPISDDLFVEVPYDDAEAERIGYSNYSYWGSTLRVFLKNKVSVAILIFLVAVLLFTFIQPYLPNQFDPYIVNNDPNGETLRNVPPNSTFWFGTNVLGQDLWSRIWQGTRTSLIIGFCAAIAAKLGMEFEVADMDFDAIIGAVQSGKATFGMAGMTVTEERQLMVGFSDSYATGVQVVIVKEDSAITSVDDLFAEGAKTLIGVQMATTGDLYATWDLEDAGLATINRYPNGNDATMALVAGKVDCVIIDNEPAKAYVAANEGLKVLETSYAVEEYAACIAKNNTELLEKFDAALTELIADGTVAEIIGKYIKAE